MIYSLLQKEHNKSVSAISSFELNCDIDDLCCVDKFGFLFSSTSSHCVGLVTNEGELTYPWLGKLNQSGMKNGNKEVSLMESPSSVCYDKESEICYVVEHQGRVFRRIDIQSPYIAAIIGGSDQKKIDQHYRGSFKTGAVIASDINGSGFVYMANSVMNRIFWFRPSKVNLFAGSGKRGYCTSNNFKACMFNAPEGIACNGKDIIVSDTGNSCIRLIQSDGVKVVAGFPMRPGDKDGKGSDSLLTSPKKIRAKKGFAYFIDGNKIKHLTLSSYQVETIYESEKVVSIDLLDKKLFILERE